MTVSSFAASRFQRMREFAQAARECVGAFGNGVSSPASNTLAIMVGGTESVALVVPIARFVGTGGTSSGDTMTALVAAAGVTVLTSLLSTIVNEARHPPAYPERPERTAYRLGVVASPIMGAAAGALAKLML